MASQQLPDPPPYNDERHGFDLNLAHGHKDLVQAVAFNAYGDRCATGAVDGKIRVFNRHKDGVWRLCDNWNAHGGEIFEVIPCSLNNCRFSSRERGVIISPPFILLEIDHRDTSLTT